MVDQNLNLNQDTMPYLNIEKAAREAQMVHWRSIFAGLFIAVLTYLTLMSLGMAIGAGALRDVIQGEDSLQTLGTGAGIWTLLCVLISLFAGSYATSRVSGMVTTRVGYFQGLVVAALFFTLMISQVGAGLGIMGQGMSRLSSMASGVTGQLVNNQRLNILVEDAFGDLQLRSDITTVTTGVVSRLLRGDQEAATTYLANQTGIAREDAQARLAAINSRFQQLLSETGEAAAATARVIGWSAFISMLLGAIAAMFGGAVGVQVSIRHPVDKLDRNAFPAQRPVYNS